VPLCTARRDKRQDARNRPASRARFLKSWQEAGRSGRARTCDPAALAATQHINVPTGASPEVIRLSTIGLSQHKKR
jgi:hypothetical protein